MEEFENVLHIKAYNFDRWWEWQREEGLDEWGYPKYTCKEFYKMKGRNDPGFEWGKGKGKGRGAQSSQGSQEDDDRPHDEEPQQERRDNAREIMQAQDEAEEQQREQQGDEGPEEEEQEHYQEDEEGSEEDEQGHYQEDEEGPEDDEQEECQEDEQEEEEQKEEQEQETEEKEVHVPEPDQASLPPAQDPQQQRIFALIAALQALGVQIPEYEGHAQLRAVLQALEPAPEEGRQAKESHTKPTEQAQLTPSTVQTPEAEVQSTQPTVTIPAALARTIPVKAMPTQPSKPMQFTQPIQTLPTTSSASGTQQGPVQPTGPLPVGRVPAGTVQRLAHGANKQGEFSA